MDSLCCYAGSASYGGTPNWEPLLGVAPGEIDDFMWMFEVELEDGAKLQVYKHYYTRQYLHLDEGGCAFIYCCGGRYREVDSQELLTIVLRRRPD